MCGFYFWVHLDMDYYSSQALIVVGLFFSSFVCFFDSINCLWLFVAARFIVFGDWLSNSALRFSLFRFHFVFWMNDWSILLTGFDWLIDCSYLFLGNRPRSEYLSHASWSNVYTNATQTLFMGAEIDTGLVFCIVGNCIETILCRLLLLLLLHLACIF